MISGQTCFAIIAALFLVNRSDVERNTAILIDNALSNIGDNSLKGLFTNAAVPDLIFSGHDNA
jgi:hypothetical protein